MTPPLFRALRTRRMRGSSTRGTTLSARQSVRVHDITRAARDALLVELRPVEPDQELETFDAGAHVDLHLDEHLVRQYSLVSHGEDTARYLVCVRHDPNGRGGSAAVHERLTVGDVVEVSRPRNTFPLGGSDSSAVLLAGGVGITPFVTMAEQLHRRGTPFELHAWSRDADALPLLALLTASPWRDRITLHHSDDGDSFRTSWPRSLESVDDGGAVYACGPEGFVSVARDRARAAGWRTDQVRCESFDPPAEPTRDGDRTFTVVARSTGERIEVGADESIADALERRGYETYRSCGQGHCGSCLTAVLAGVPDHRDDFQTEVDHAAGTRINTCCSRSLSPVLELDV